MSRELLKQALEALKGYRQNHDDHQPCDAEKAIETFLAQPEPEPVAWMSKTFPTTFAISKDVAQPEMFFTPLYTTPPDQSSRIAQLEKSEAFLKDAVDRAIQDTEYYQEQLAALQAKREPLSDDEIRDCAESENLHYFENKEEIDAFARAIEEAHGIGTNYD